MEKRNPREWLCFKRTVRFGETDAAGVVHFLELFRWCHEAWEESLERYGLIASEIFPNANSGRDHTRISIGLPIVHCEADFWKPMQTGDQLEIQLTPQNLNRGKLQIKYKFKQKSEDIAQALVRHQAINSLTRSISTLPEGIELWLEASVLNQGITSC